MKTLRDVLVDGFQGAHNTEVVFQLDGDDLLCERFEYSMEGLGSVCMGKGDVREHELGRGLAVSSCGGAERLTILGEEEWESGWQGGRVVWVSYVERSCSTDHLASS